MKDGCYLGGVFANVRWTLLSLAIMLAACKQGTRSEPCHAANVGVAGAKTGGSTAVEGVKTFGSSAAGLVKGGSDEAKTRWKDGARETKKTAHEGGAETKAASQDKQCH
jgi:hypothetical protein